MTLVAGITQQFAAGLPGVLTGHVTGNAGHQRQRLFKLTVRRFRYAQLLLQAQQSFCRLFLFGLEAFLPFSRIFNAQIG